MDRNCERVRENLSRFLDNDLSGREAVPIAAHLETCVGCRHEFDSLRAVRDGVHAFHAAGPSAGELDSARQRVFARLEDAVRREAQEEETRKRRLIPWKFISTMPSLRLPHWQPYAAVAVAAVAVGISVWQPWQPTPTRTVGTIANTPADAELSVLFDLHDVHGAELTADDPVVRRGRVADARASLMNRQEEPSEDPANL